jgi:hypothetical protein
MERDGGVPLALFLPRRFHVTPRPGAILADGEQSDVPWMLDAGGVLGDGFEGA